MECYYRSDPIDKNAVPPKGYRQRMYRELLERGPFGDLTEQRICDQARTIRKKWTVNGSRARDAKEKNQHNRTTVNTSGRESGC